MSKQITKIKLKLKPLHPKQKVITDNAKRFNHLRCGRRFGKTTMIEELSLPAINKFPVGIWFPTYKDLSEVWKDIKKTYRDVIQEKNETLHQLIMYGGGLIDFWSMDDPEAGQGRKYKRAIIDEAAKAPKLYQAWENTIRPTLTDLRGDGYILSRPKGKNNPFYQLEEKHRKFDNWAFFHFTTRDNPYIDPKEIDEAKTQLDDINFRQEYDAEYVDANDRPFLYKFSEAKHVIDDYAPNPHLPILFSFDFNKEPMTCLVGQQINEIESRAFDEIDLPEGSTPEVCDQIIVNWGKVWSGSMLVTGDSTGQNRSALVVGNLNHYRIIKSKLGLLDRDLLYPKQNMALSDSRVLCNSVLQNASFLITKKCEKTIKDLKAAFVDSNGELVKNSTTSGLHHFDTWRYMAHAFYPDWIKNADKYKNN